MDGYNICLILIGGFSRSGKTTLLQGISSLLPRKDISNIVVSLDAWIISLENRRPGSSVLERYECNSINKSITILLEGGEIFPPVYDAALRRRVTERSSEPVSIPSGIVIVEGVVALASEDLRKRVMLKSVMDLAGSERIIRVKRYYIDEKQLPEGEASRIGEEREREEIPLLRKTRQYADIVFSHTLAENQRS